MSDTVCDKCGETLSLGSWPFCPHPMGTAGVIGDECDVWIKHGICNPDGTPKRYRSKSEIREAAYNSGLFQGGDTPKINPRLQEERARQKESKRS